MSTWPNKTVPNCTNEELAEAIERHQGNPDATSRQMVQHP